SQRFIPSSTIAWFPALGLAPPPEHRGTPPFTGPRSWQAHAGSIEMAARAKAAHGPAAQALHASSSPPARRVRPKKRAKPVLDAAPTYGWHAWQPPWPPPSPPQSAMDGRGRFGQGLRLSRPTLK